MFDLFAVQLVSNLRRRSDRLVVVAPEAWPSELDQPTIGLEPFELVDHVFVGGRAAASAIGRVVDRPSSPLPPAVDVLRFAAKGWQRPRPIFAFNPGRRSPGQHRRLLDQSERGAGIYLYDTLTGGSVTDATAHRAHYSRVLQDTDLLVTNYAKFDLPDTIGTSREVPGRVFEGLAAGCRLIGEAPDTEALAAAGLDGAVIHPFDLDGRTFPVLDEADGPAERAANIGLAARTADWAHRWQRITSTMGIGMGSEVARRLQELGELVERADAVVG